MNVRALGWTLLLTTAALGMNAAHAAGRFVVLAPMVETAEGRSDARIMQDSGFLQEVAKALNSVFVLPRDVGLRYAECGEPNAYYDPGEHHILMCLELMQAMAETIQGQYEDEESANEAVAGAYIAVALHEAGHALVDVLEIPVTGREEDAVDQLSAWMLIEADDVDSVLGAAASYYTEDEVGDDDFADEHSLSKQRYFNLLCWAYGSDPENSNELIEVWALPSGRAERCEEEYAQLDRSWTRLLSEHLRDEEEAGEELAIEAPAVAEREVEEEAETEEAPTPHRGSGGFIQATIHEPGEPKEEKEISGGPRRLPIGRDDD